MPRLKLRTHHWVTGSSLVAILLLQHLLWGHSLSVLFRRHESTVVHVDQVIYTSKDRDEPAASLHAQGQRRADRREGTAVSTTVTVEHRPVEAVHEQPASGTVVHLQSQPKDGPAGVNSSSSSTAGNAVSKPSTVSQPNPRSSGNASSAVDTTATGSSSSSSKTIAAAPRAELSDSSILAPVLTAAARSKSDPVYYQKLKEAASKPINIVVMTGLFWQLPTTHTQGCTVDGIPLDCHISKSGTEEELNKADALYYHVPSFSGQPRKKAFPEQLRIAMSLESAAYYPSLDNPGYMCQFDAEMTYRTCAQVTNWYSLEALHKLFNVAPVPFEEKLHAIAYINSNCEAQSGRSDIMRKLIALGDKAKVPVHSLGRCDNNTPWPPGRPNKVQVMRKYKFCVAMENSVRQDYMTEKMWDGLAAGCIPIYMGSKNAQHIIPDPNGVIMYDPAGSGHASTPEQLDAVMHEIGSDKQRYEAMVAWKHKKPEEQPSEIFRYLWSARHNTGECFLCQFLARHRAEPQPRYTTCLFNKSWMKSAGQPYTSEEEACHRSPA